MKSPKILALLVIIITLFLFFPAFQNFYSHDDFYHFKISQTDSFSGFLKFFSFANRSDDWKYYRPLTTQVLYFIIANLFNYSPVAAHIIAFFLFYCVLFLVYRFLLLLTKNQKLAVVAVLFYAFSTSHFSHLYSIANQELGHAVFYLTACIAFLKLLDTKKKIFLIYTITAYLLALASKEFAVTFPAAALLIYLYRSTNSPPTTPKLIKLILYFIPIGLITIIYLYLYFFILGINQGDSYIWIFSPRVFLNNLIWYFLWSLGLPRMLNDYITFTGQINPNLFKYWSRLMIPLFTIFTAYTGIIIFLTIKNYRSFKKSRLFTIIFAFLWFCIGLSPVLFLAWHKFTTYLTLPLIGVSLAISLILNSQKLAIRQSKILSIAEGLADHKTNFVLILFFIVYISFSALSLNIERKTDWITRGAAIAKKVYDYLEKQYPTLNQPITLAFYDLPSDQSLYLGPAQEVELALSKNNFFDVFYHHQIQAVYLKNNQSINNPAVILIPARQFVNF